MAATLPGTPILSRLKSMTRYCCLAPPPWCRIVRRPRLFRPPVRCLGRSSDFSGVVFVISAKSATVPKRRPGEVGLYCLRGMVSDSLERRPENAAERLALSEGDERLLPVRGLHGRAPAGALRLTLDDDRIDRLHLAAPQRLHCAPD